VGQKAILEEGRRTSYRTYGLPYLLCIIPVSIMYSDFYDQLKFELAPHSSWFCDGSDPDVVLRDEGARLIQLRGDATVKLGRGFIR
jgi:hypothetical protein